MSHLWKYASMIICFSNLVCIKKSWSIQNISKHVKTVFKVKKICIEMRGNCLTEI